MSTEIQIIEQVMLQGNLRNLTPPQKVQYYSKVCESLGLNPLTKPFEYITLNGKEVLYATKACTEQLRLIKKVSLKIVDRQKIDGVYIVTAEAKDSDGREDSATGAVAIEGLKGDALANAMMKAETKAKRRVTLSICGLGMLDESEIETIPQHVQQPTAHPVIQSKPAQVIESGDYKTFTETKNEQATMRVTAVQESGELDFDRSYTMPFGKKYIGQTLEQIGPDNVKSFGKWLISDSLKKGKELDGQALEFYQKGREYLKTMGMDYDV